jgi:hypothetical protein
MEEQKEKKARRAQRKVGRLEVPPIAADIETGEVTVPAVGNSGAAE